MEQTNELAAVELVKLILSGGGSLERDEVFRLYAECAGVVRGEHPALVRYALDQEAAAVEAKLVKLAAVKRAIE